MLAGSVGHPCGRHVAVRPEEHVLLNAFGDTHRENVPTLPTLVPRHASPTFRRFGAGEPIARPSPTIVNQRLHSIQPLCADRRSRC